MGVIGGVGWLRLERKWRVVTVLFAGSILTSGIAVINVGDEVEMTEFVRFVA